MYFTAQPVTVDDFRAFDNSTHCVVIKPSLVIIPALPTERSIWTCIKTIHYRWSVRSIIVMYDTLCPEMCREHRCFQHSWLVCGERSVMLLSPVGWSCLYFSWQARTWSSGRNTVGSVWVVTVLWQLNDHSLPYWCHTTAPCRIVLLKWPAWSASVSHLLSLAKGSDCWYGAPDPFIFTKNPRSHTNKIISLK